MYIYIILLIILSSIFICRNSIIYTNVIIKHGVMCLSFLLLFIIYVFRYYTVGTDYPLYYSIFITMNKSQPNYQTMEIGYRWLNSFSQYYNNFIIISIFAFAVTFLGFYILSKCFNVNSYSFLFFYLVTSLYLFSFDGLRQFIAFGIICLGLSFYIKCYNKRFRKYIIFIIFIILATMFHASAKVCIILLLLTLININYKTVIYGAIFTTIGYFTTFIKGILNKSVFFFPHYMMKYGGNLSGSGNNLSNITGNSYKGIIQFIPIALQFIFLFIYMYKYNKQKYHLNYKAKFILNGYLAFLLMYAASGDILAFRLQIYLDMFPILFSCIFVDGTKDIKISKLSVSLRYSLIIFWIVYFVIRLIMNNSGVVPYMFI